MALICLIQKYINSIKIEIYLIDLDKMMIVKILFMFKPIIFEYHL
jgi:hypothetical protein